MSSATEHSVGQEDEDPRPQIVYVADTAKEDERLRLHYQHVALTMVLDGRLLLSPLKKAPKNVLDLATGTAEWAYDLAKQYPNSTILGVDITKALDPDPPSNFKFEFLDIQQEWAFPEPFDVIHSRLLFTIQLDFSKLFAQAYANLAPGGYLELHDCVWPLQHDGDLDPASSSALWLDGFAKGLSALGLNWDTTSKFDTLVKEQGFLDVQVRKYRAAYGEWPEDPKEYEVGRLMGRECYPRFLPWWRVIFIKGTGWSDEYIRKIEDGVTAEIESRKARFWVEYRVITGKKPE